MSYKLKMLTVLFILTSLLLMNNLCKGQTELQYAHPPNGTVIGHLIGETENIRITCNITHNGNQTNTVWFISNYRGTAGLRTIGRNNDFSFLNITGDPRPTDNSGLKDYGNHLTIVQFDGELEGALLHCGSGGVSLALFPLKVYIPSSEPFNLTGIDQGATWISISWEPPATRGSPPVSNYEITAESCNATNSSQLTDEEITIILTMSNGTTFNVTGLMPNTAYMLSVSAISEFKGQEVVRSNRSESIMQKTSTTIPALRCSDTPAIVIDTDTTITIIFNWSYAHTGGLPLTQLTVQYTVINTTTSEPVVSMSYGENLTDTSIRETNVSHAAHGLEYRLTVSATNNKGKASVECLPASIDIYAVQVVLRPIQNCETWVASSTSAKIQTITDNLQQAIHSNCNCTSFTQELLFNITLQCNNDSPVLHLNLLQIHSQQHIDLITAWIVSRPTIDIGGDQYTINGDCPVDVSSLKAGPVGCQTEIEVTTDIMNGTSNNQTVLLVAILASVLGILLTVVVVCLLVVCYMCCTTDNLMKPRLANKIEVELSAWNIDDIPEPLPLTRENSTSAVEANDYEVVADIITNPMYRTVAREPVTEQQHSTQGDASLQSMYDTPKAS